MAASLTLGSTRSPERTLTMDLQEARSRVSALMPTILDELYELVALPSIAFPGYPPEPVEAMADRTLELFREAGVTDARRMEVPTGYRPIYGEIPGPAGSPVVVLYGHYDVQPAPPEQGWTSDPWVPTRKGWRSAPLGLTSTSPTTPAARRR